MEDVIEGERGEWKEGRMSEGGATAIGRSTVEV